MMRHPNRAASKYAKMTSKAYPWPALTADQRDALTDAMLEIESIDWVFSEADAALDNLAGELRDSFFPARDAAFAGRTPSLYDVIEQLSIRFGLAEDALEAADEMKTRLEDSYREVEDNYLMEEVKEWADRLLSELRKFIASNGNQRRRRK